MSYRYVITSDEGEVTVQLTLDGTTHTISGTESVGDLVSALVGGADEETVRRFIDPQRGLTAYLNRISTRLLYNDDSGQLFFDGDEVHGTVVETLIERYRQGFVTAEPVINFLEKVAANPSKVSRDELYLFLEKHSLTLLSNGNFLAYKGVQEDMKSVHAGPGIVNGQSFDHAQLSNDVGNIVEFPRAKVDPNRNVTCSVGLHVGAYSYASTFAPVTVLVEVDPRDVVSVPYDHDDTKMRVCRYVVREIVKAKQQRTFYHDDLTEEVGEDEYADTCYAFITELKDAASVYTHKGKVGNSYVDIATALGYGSDSPEAFIAETLDQRHTAQAVYRYHIDAL